MDDCNDKSESIKSIDRERMEVKVKVLTVIIRNEGARVKVKVLKVIVGKGWVQQCPEIWVREWLGPKVDKR